MMCANATVAAMNIYVSHAILNRMPSRVAKLISSRDDSDDRLELFFFSKETHTLFYDCAQ